MSIYKKGKSGAEEIRIMMENFRNSPPETLSGSKVVQVHDYLKQVSSNKTDHSTSPISLPKSNVLQYITEDQTKVSIRPSGTEPKIKFYFSVKGELGKAEDYLKTDKFLDEKIERIKEELGLLEK